MKRFDFMHLLLLAVGILFVEGGGLPLLALAILRPQGLFSLVAPWPIALVIGILILVRELQLRPRRNTVRLAVACPVLILVTVAFSLFVPGYGPSLHSAKEAVLRNDLFTMRSIIDQATLDKQKPPQSLTDLVASGYLKELPTDPMTGRKDTWAVEWSADPQKPGIVNIRSGSKELGSDGRPYNSW